MEDNSCYSSEDSVSPSKMSLQNEDYQLCDGSKAPTLLPVHCSYIVNSPKHNVKKTLDVEDFKRKKMKMLNDTLQNSKEKRINLLLGDNVAYNQDSSECELKVEKLFTSVSNENADKMPNSTECRSHQYDGYIAGRKLYHNIQGNLINNLRGLTAQDMAHKPRNCIENNTFREVTGCSKGANLGSAYVDNCVKAKASMYETQKAEFLKQLQVPAFDMCELSKNETLNCIQEVNYGRYENEMPFKQSQQRKSNTSKNKTYSTKSRRTFPSPQSSKSSNASSSFLESRSSKMLRSLKHTSVSDQFVADEKQESNHSNNFLFSSDEKSVKEDTLKNDRIQLENGEGSEGTVETINSSLGKKALTLYQDDIRNIASQLENFPETPADNADSFRGFQGLNLGREKLPWVKEGLDGNDVEAKFGHLTNFLSCDEVNYNTAVEEHLRTNMKLLNNKVLEDEVSFDDPQQSLTVRNIPDEEHIESNTKRHQTQNEPMLKHSKNNNRNKGESRFGRIDPHRYNKDELNTTEGSYQSDLTVGNVRQMTKHFEKQQLVDVYEKVSRWIKRDFAFLTSCPEELHEPFSMTSTEEVSSASKKKKSKKSNPSSQTLTEEPKSKSLHGTKKTKISTVGFSKHGDCLNCTKQDKTTSCTTLQKRIRKKSEEMLTKKSTQSSCTDKEDFKSAKSKLSMATKLSSKHPVDVACQQDSPILLEYIQYTPAVQRKASRNRKNSKKRSRSSNSEATKKCTCNCNKKSSSSKKCKENSSKGDTTSSSAPKKRNASMNGKKALRNPSKTKKRARSLQSTRNSSKSPTGSSRSPRGKSYNGRKPFEINIETKQTKTKATKEEKLERELMKENAREASKRQTDYVKRLVKEKEGELERKLLAIEKRKVTGGPKLNIYKYMEIPPPVNENCEYYEPLPSQKNITKTATDCDKGEYYEFENHAGPKLCKNAGKKGDVGNDGDEEDWEEEETAHYHKNWKIDYFEYLRGREIAIDEDSEVTVEAIQQLIKRDVVQKPIIRKFKSPIFSKIPVHDVNGTENDKPEKQEKSNYSYQQTVCGDMVSKDEKEGIKHARHQAASCGDAIVCTEQNNIKVSDDATTSTQKKKKTKKRTKKIFVVKRNPKRTTSLTSTDSNTLTLPKDSGRLRRSENNEKGEKLAIGNKNEGIPAAEPVSVEDSIPCPSVSQNLPNAEAKAKNIKTQNLISPVVQNFVEESLRNENILIQFHKQSTSSFPNSEVKNESRGDKGLIPERQQQIKPYVLDPDASTITTCSRNDRKQIPAPTVKVEEKSSLFHTSSTADSDRTRIECIDKEQQLKKAVPLILQDIEVQLDAKDLFQGYKNDKNEVPTPTETGMNAGFKCPKTELLSLNRDVSLLLSKDEELLDRVSTLTHTPPAPPPIVQLFIHEKSNKDLSSNVKSLYDAIDSAKETLTKMTEQQVVMNGNQESPDETLRLTSESKVSKADLNSFESKPSKENGHPDKALDALVVKGTNSAQATDNLYPATKTRAIILDAIAAALNKARERALEEEKRTERNFMREHSGDQDPKGDGPSPYRPKDLHPRRYKKHNKPRSRRHHHHHHHHHREVNNPYKRQRPEFGCDFESSPKPLHHPPSSAVSSSTDSTQTNLSSSSPKSTLKTFKKRLESSAKQCCKDSERNNFKRKVNDHIAISSNRCYSTESDISSPCKEPYTSIYHDQDVLPTQIRRSKTIKMPTTSPKSRSRPGHFPNPDIEDSELLLSKVTRRDVSPQKDRPVDKLSLALAREFLNYPQYGEMKRNKREKNHQPREANHYLNILERDNRIPKEKIILESPRQYYNQLKQAKIRAEGAAETVRVEGMFEDFTQGIQLIDEKGLLCKLVRRKKPKLYELTSTNPRRPTFQPEEVLTVVENSNDCKYSPAQHLFYDKKSPERVMMLEDYDEDPQQLISPRKSKKKYICSWNDKCSGNQILEDGHCDIYDRKVKSGPLPRSNENKIERSRCAWGEPNQEKYLKMATDLKSTSNKTGLNCVQLTGNMKRKDNRKKEKNAKYVDECLNKDDYRCCIEKGYDSQGYGCDTTENYEEFDIDVTEEKRRKCGNGKENNNEYKNRFIKGDKDRFGAKQDQHVEAVYNKMAKCIDSVNITADELSHWCSDDEENLEYSVNEVLDYDRIDFQIYDQDLYDVEEKYIDDDDDDDDNEEDGDDEGDNTQWNSNRSSAAIDHSNKEEDVDCIADEEEVDDEVDTFSILSCMSNDMSSMGYDRNGQGEKESDEVDEDDDDDDDKEEEEEEEYSIEKQERGEDILEKTINEEEIDEEDNDDDDDDQEEDGEDSNAEKEDYDDDEDEDDDDDDDDNGDDDDGFERYEEVTVIQGSCDRREKGYSTPPNCDDDLEEDARYDNVHNVLMVWEGSIMNTSNIIDHSCDDWLVKNDNNNEEDNDEYEEETDSDDCDCDASIDNEKDGDRDSVTVWRIDDGDDDKNENEDDNDFSESGNDDDNEEAYLLHYVSDKKHAV